MSRLLQLIPLLLTTVLSGQAPYFQQHLDYRIQAELDDQKHLLRAFLTLEYQNNSPDTLDRIVFHLWPRAYGEDNTAFAKQQLRDGNTNFHFSDVSRRGTLDSLDFRVAGQKIKWSYDRVHPDLAQLELSTPLLPGRSVTITTPFRVIIPASFSRLGHVGESYQMTQWYPKPAVYDRSGWHPMPYLDRGEFYSEFGNFEVSLTLPANYTVGATGVLATDTERQRLLDLAGQTATSLALQSTLATGFVEEPFPPSTPTTKTLVYRAERVHDFAWFADKRFQVLHDTMQVPGGRVIDVWSYFNASEAQYWKNSIQYLKQAVRFYSQAIGPYPYPQVSAAQAARSAGGGMEYPMITLIGLSGTATALDEVLAHEVGHNWFYGVLGSNERDHAWMDEGLNSYYEARYMQQYYGPNYHQTTLLGDTVNWNEVSYRYLARAGRHQPPNTPSDELTVENYWFGSYSKPALALEHLERRVGVETIDLIMNTYFQRWSFKHPQPEDLRQVVQAVLHYDIPWLFDGFLDSQNYLDYWQKGGEIKQRGGIKAPVWYKTLTGEEKLASASGPPPPSSRLQSGPLDLFPENDVEKAPLRIRPFIKPVARGSRQLFWLPLAGYNAHDGLQLGAGLHNRTLEAKPFEFLVAPAYGVNSSSLTGFTGFQWRPKASLTRPFPLSTGPKLRVGLQRFSNRSFQDEQYQYWRGSAHFSIPLPTENFLEKSAQLSFQLITIQQEVPDFNLDGMLIGAATFQRSFFRSTLDLQWDRTINPARLIFSGEGGIPNGPLESSFTKLTATYRGGFQFEPGEWIRWRVFGGYFLTNSLRDRNFFPTYAFGLVDNAATDYGLDQVYLGRSEDGIFEQQNEVISGGFRAPVSPAFGFGRSNDYVVAINLDADLPFAPSGFPIGVYLDAGTYGQSPLQASAEAAFQWVGGFSLTALNGTVGIFAPVAGSPDLRNLLEQRGGFFDRLSFRLNLSGLLPWQWIDDISW